MALTPDDDCLNDDSLTEAGLPPEQAGRVLLLACGALARMERTAPIFSGRYTAHWAGVIRPQPERDCVENGSLKGGHPWA